ncbi:hypothetical protein MXD63_45320, partial [Frankia sp. Cpl3]|nr:hypothetical protein [Frankia sp. Cpl3]
MERFIDVVQAWPREDITYTELEASAGVGENVAQLLFFHAEQVGATAEVMATRSGYQFRKQAPSDPELKQTMGKQIACAK